MENILHKKLQPMGNTVYFLMNSDDVLMYNLVVGDFYTLDILNVSKIKVMLKLYGTSKVFQIKKQFCNKHSNLKKNNFYDIIIMNTNNIGKDLTKNSEKYKELVFKVDKLATKVGTLSLVKDYEKYKELLVKINKLSSELTKIKSVIVDIQK